MRYALLVAFPLGGRKDADTFTHCHQIPHAAEALFQEGTAERGAVPARAWFHGVK